MHELDKYFLKCLEAERTQFALEIDEQSRELWPSALLVKRIKKLLVDDSILSSDLDGPSGAVASLKAAARGNEHAERVRRLIVRKLVDTDTFQIASRRVLKNWIAEWAQQDVRWQRAPIRFYPASNTMAPCIVESGHLKNRKDIRVNEPCFQFDATWLWDHYCVYAWHRWADDENDIKDLPELMQACAQAQDSIYKDRPAKFLFIVHGPYAEAAREQLLCPPNARLVTPWEISTALTDMSATSLSM